jgi:hypothetical protein
MQPQQVEFVVVEVRTEFDAGDNAHPQPFARVDGFIEPVDGVVIGERDGVQQASSEWCIPFDLRHILLRDV